MQQLIDQFPQAVKTDVSLAPYSWWKIGGTADGFIEIQSQEQLVQVVRVLKTQSIRWCLIGRGTNLLFDDAGFRGCVLRLGNGMAQMRFQQNKLTVQAGCWTPAVALAAARRGLSGIEHTIGIPASLGGLICMNGGSQRKGIGDIVETVTALSQGGELVVYPRSECDFSYRHSRFHMGDEIAVAATLKFIAHRPYEEQRPVLLGILRERNRKFPRKLPSCGSVFKSSPELYEAYGPPGKVIEDMGFKGQRRGNIEVSARHANFIVNNGGGSSVEVLSLVREIMQTVHAKTGIVMQPEFRYLHPEKGIVEIS